MNEMLHIQQAHRSMARHFPISEPRLPAEKDRRGRKRLSAASRPFISPMSNRSLRCRDYSTTNEIG